MSRRAAAIVLLVLGLGVWRASADTADRVVADYMRAHPIPGLALEIIQDGQIVKRTAYGKANLEWDTPVTTNTAFEIGSMTKQFTSAAILMLAAEGRIDLHKPISAYLSNTPPAWRDITVRQLLSHTSGLKNYTLLDGFEFRRHLTQAQFVELLGKEPLLFAPGAQWKYCNSGFNLLAYIVENVSGKHYWDFLQERIFTPLGMTHTTRRDPAQVIPFRASGYETNKAGHYINRDYDLTDLFGAGAMVSTLDDLAKWNASLDSGALLDETTRRAMWTDAKLNNGKPCDYGYGWFLSTVDGHAAVGHGGSTSGFSATIQRFPEDHLAIIILSNANEDGLATRIAKDMAAALFKEKSAGKSAEHTEVK